MKTGHACMDNYIMCDNYTSDDNSITSHFFVFADLKILSFLNCCGYRIRHSGETAKRIGIESTRIYNANSNSCALVKTGSLNRDACMGEPRSHAIVYIIQTICLPRNLQSYLKGLDYSELRINGFASWGDSRWPRHFCYVNIWGFFERHTLECRQFK